MTKKSCSRMETGGRLRLPRILDLKASIADTFTVQSGFDFSQCVHNKINMSMLLKFFHILGTRVENTKLVAYYCPSLGFFSEIFCFSSQ